MTKHRTTTRVCEACGNGKVARFPKDNPHFCTMKCAAMHAAGESHYVWCDKHGDWYHEDDGCYECDKENDDA